MPSLRVWLRAPRNLMVLFLLVMLLPAVTLVGLGWRLLEQDRALESQRLTELREGTADRMVRSLEQALAATEKRLARGELDVPEDAVRVIIGPGGIEATPAGRLLYYPTPPPLKEAPDGPFREAEDLEFRAQNYQRAVEVCRALSGSADPAVRAGALLRQARVLRKAGRHQEALEAYRALARIPAVSLGGTPADLVARRAQCAVLKELDRTADLRAEAQALQRDFEAGRWRLDRPLYLHCAAEISGWLGIEWRANPQQEALASAVEWLWQKWNQTPRGEFPPSGRQGLSFGEIAVTVLWGSAPDRVLAFVAGPRYLERNWLAGLAPVSPGMRVWLAGVGGRPVPEGVAKTERTASETGLPWSVFVGTPDPHPALEEFASRRRLLLAGLCVLGVLVIAGSYFIWRTITRELAVAQLQTDFVSAVSHEFRTPLTSLGHLTELLTEDDSLPPEKRRSFYQAQTRATERLRRLVESLLDFGRMEAGARPYEFQRVDAAPLAEAVVEEFRKEISSQGFDLQCRRDAGEHPVEADADALSRALWNLLDNAVKYSGDGRAILVEVGRRDSSVAISVRDRGVGIPRGEQREIFRKFVRGSGARALGIKGTGIGLAMVRHIVDAHGGAVELVSAPGEGSTFTIFLRGARC
jgi:signal transduction histidine kinase